MNNNQVALMAERLCVEQGELHNIVLNTLMPGKVKPTTDQFISFLAVANEYKLNPLTKEIYAFPAKGGGIQPIVSIDGWLKIINCHPEFNGMQFKDIFDANGALLSVTCRMHRKDREHPTEVTEYLSECNKGTEPWIKWPARMLRHKATIQAARYAFGFSGIVDPDEGERIQESQIKDVAPQKENFDTETVITYYSQADFDANLPKWIKGIKAGKLTIEKAILRAETKGQLTDQQKEILTNSIDQEAA